MTNPERKAVEDELECSEGESCQDRPLIRNLDQHIAQIEAIIDQSGQFINELNARIAGLEAELKQAAEHYRTATHIKVARLEAENKRLREEADEAVDFAGHMELDLFAISQELNSRWLDHRLLRPIRKLKADLAAKQQENERLAAPVRYAHFDGSGKLVVPGFEDQ